MKSTLIDIIRHFILPSGYECDNLIKTLTRYEVYPLDKYEIIDDMITDAFKTYFGIIYKYIYYQVKNEELARDMTQEVFIDAYIKRKLFQTVTNKKAWLLKAAYFIVLRYQCRQKEKDNTTLPLDDVDDYRIEQSVISGYYKDNLDEYRKLLSEDEFKILEYKYLYNFQNTEIAQIFKINKSTCDKRLQRIRDKIKSVIINADFK